MGLAFVAVAAVDTIHPATLVTGTWWLVLVLVLCTSWPAARAAGFRELRKAQIVALPVLCWLFFRASTAVLKAAKTWDVFDSFDAFYGFNWLVQDALAAVIVAALFAVPLLRAFRHEAPAAAFVIATPWIIVTCTDTAFDLARWSYEPWSQYLWLLEGVFPALLLMYACERLSRATRPRAVPQNLQFPATLATFLRGGAGPGRTTIAVAMAVMFVLALTRIEPAPPVSLVSAVPLLDSSWEIALLAATLLLTVTTIAMIRALRTTVPRSGRSRLYGRGAEHAIAFLLLAPAWVLTVFHAVPIIGASTFQTVRKPPTPDWSIQYDDRAHTVHVSGGFGPGIASDLAEVLTTHRDAVAVQLSGPGGRLREGMQIAEVIEARGLATIVSERCISACTFAFVGGRERIVAGNGALGFHASRSPSVLLQWLKDTDLEDRFRKQRGLDDHFIARANAVPNHEIWYPTRDELLAARVVTEVR